MCSKLIVLCFLFSVTLSAVLAESEVANKRPRYHVDILKLNDDDSLTHLCDGAILDSRHVLTAAHCVHDIANMAEIRVRSGSDVAPPPQMAYKEERLFHRVVKAMLPADYVHLPCRSHEHDIAILKVSRSFDLAYDRLYRQVNLPEPTNDYEAYKAVVSGYTKDDKLDIFESKVISNEECMRNATAIITKGNVCSVVQEDAEVHADFGGSPLVHDNVVIGVMNAPKKCAAFNSNGFECEDQSSLLKLYTRVTAYLDFIQNVLNSQASSAVVYRS